MASVNNKLLNILFFIVTVDAISQISNKAEPSFISRSETFKFVAGETIMLPCEVSNPGEFVT